MTFSPHDSKSLHYVRAEVPLVRLMLRESCDLLSGFVRYEQFDQLKQPIKAAHFIELILESFAENAVDVLPVLELAMSESTPRWFPPRDEIVDVLRTSAPIFWHNLLRDFTVQSIESVIKLVGNPHEINFRGVVTAGLQRIPFEPDFMKLVYNLNFSGVCAANLLPLDHIDEPNYFFKVESPEALEWLLKLLGDEECRIQLRLANDSTHNRTALVQYYHDSQLDLVQKTTLATNRRSSSLFMMTMLNSCPLRDFALLLIIWSCSNAALRPLGSATFPLALASFSLGFYVSMRIARTRGVRCSTIGSNLSFRMDLSPTFSPKG
jgi:hypothetical protein